MDAPGKSGVLQWEKKVAQSAGHDPYVARAGVGLGDRSRKAQGQEGEAVESAKREAEEERLNRRRAAEREEGRGCV